MSRFFIHSSFQSSDDQLYFENIIIHYIIFVFDDNVSTKHTPPHHQSLSLIMCMVDQNFFCSIDQTNKQTKNAKPNQKKQKTIITIL